MIIDYQTLNDLEIFRVAEDGASLFDTLDKTTTAGGKYLLRQKYQNPLSSKEQICATQQTVAFLSERLHQWQFPFSDSSLKSIDNYITSNINPVKPTTPLSLFLQGINCYFLDREAFRYLKESIVEIAGFTNHFVDFFESKNPVEFPKHLQNLFQNIKSISTAKPIAQLTGIIQKRQRLSFTSIFSFDYQLRVSHKNQLQQAVRIAYELDTLLSMAKATKEFGFNFPEIVDDGETRVEVVGLFHPLLKNPVPYNFSIPHQKNFIFLTGPNMAGKTTYLKSMGIAVFLAHLGMSVPAKSMRVNHFDSLITSLSVNDNMFKGYSYFYSEVKRVKQVAELLNQGKTAFVLFDELFKGTNVKDAYDATVLIISGLVEWRQSTFILSSHLSEVESQIKHFPEVVFFFFESEMQNGKPLFNYKIKEGVSDTRLGLTIIENEGIMELLKNPNKL